MLINSISKALLFFLFLRVLSVFIVKTWYVPDEYWQSLEVAHKLTFDYGYLTWEWSKGIRSYIHPLSIAIVYRILQWFHLDHVQCLILAPKFLHAILSAISDFYFYQWSDKSKWSIFVISSSWFWFYTAPRTLLNTVETSLTTIALSFYWRKQPVHSTSFLWLAALTCWIRPTAAILWIPLCFFHIKKSIDLAPGLLRKYLLIGFAVAWFGVSIDTYTHGSFVVTPWEFFKLNILEGVGIFYGVQPWYWYFVIGLPAVLGSYMIPFIIAIINIFQRRHLYQNQIELLYAVLFTLVVYSLLPHKEFRFILPLLPICLYITSDSLTASSRKASTFSVWNVAIVLLLSNLLPAYYFGVKHQAGTISVMDSIERIAREYRDGDGNRANVLFLMPCHSTPFYSHVHQNIPMQFLTCEPNFERKPNYTTEADEFFADPITWIMMLPSELMYTHIVLFDSLEQEISDFLVDYNLIEIIHHTDFATNRTGNNVFIYERRSSIMK